MNDEVFTPEGVDEQIERQLSFLQKNQAGQQDASIVQRLHALYEEDLQSTAHVWEHLVRQVGEQNIAERQTECLHVFSQEKTQPLLRVSHNVNPPRQQGRQPSRAGQTPFGRRVSLLVAVLVMIALVGSLAVVLHEVRPPNPPAGTSGKTLGQTVYSMTGGPEAPIFGDLAWSPDGKRVAVLRINGLQIRDATTGGNLVNAHLPADMLRTLLMAWSPDGKWIAISGMGTEVAIVDTRTGTLVHHYIVGSVAESQPAASGSSHLSTSLPTSGLAGNISGLVWSPNSQWLAVTVDGYYVYRDFRIVNAQTGALVHHFADDTGENAIDVASWSPDGKYLAAQVTRSTNTSFQMMVWVWDMSTYQVVFKQNGGGGAGGLFEHGDQIVWQSHSDNLAFATGGSDSAIEIWDVARNTLLKRYNVASIGLFAFSPDGIYLASVSFPNQPTGEHRINLIDVQSGQLVYAYTQHTSSLVALAWSPDGKYIASDDATHVRVWIAP